MGVSLDDMIATLPAERQAEVEARGQVLIHQEMTLRALRSAMGHTQVALASRLGIKQENVSRIEQRSDILLSTLNEYLASMGGRLTLVAEFEGRPPVKLGGFGDAMDVAVERKKARKRKAAKALLEA